QVTRTVDVGEARFERVEVTLTPAASLLPPALEPPRPSGSRVEARGNDSPAPPPTVFLSHRWQFGAVVRTDVDPVHEGVVLAPGARFGIADWLDGGMGALVGKSKGLEPGASFYILRGAWKPLVNLGVPIFLVNGSRVGVRGAAGVQWDPMRHFGVFVQ